MKLIARQRTHLCDNRIVIKKNKKNWKSYFCEIGITKFESIKINWCTFFFLLRYRFRFRIHLSPIVLNNVSSYVFVIAPEVLRVFFIIRLILLSPCLLCYLASLSLSVFLCCFFYRSICSRSLFRLPNKPNRTGRKKRKENLTDSAIFHISQEDKWRRHTLLPLYTKSIH